MAKKFTSITDFARSGGEALRDKYGSEHFARLGAKGRETIKKKDPEFYSRIGKISAQKRAQRKKERESGLGEVMDIITGS